MTPVSPTKDVINVIHRVFQADRSLSWGEKSGIQSKVHLTYAFSPSVWFYLQAWRDKVSNVSSYSACILGHKFYSGMFLGSHFVQCLLHCKKKKKVFHSNVSNSSMLSICFMYCQNIVSTILFISNLMEMFGLILFFFNTRHSLMLSTRGPVKWNTRNL